MRTRFWHFRQFSWPLHELCSKGGVTVCVVEDDNTALFGVAVCSLKDTYCKASGRVLALRRAGEDGAVVVEGVWYAPAIVHQMARILAEAAARAMYHNKGGTLDTLPHKPRKGKQ